jgi:hypothetical protein
MSKSFMTSWSEGDGDDDGEYASIHVSVLSRGDDDNGAPVLCTGSLKSIPTLYELTLSTGSTHHVARKRSDATPSIRNLAVGLRTLMPAL